MPAPPSDLTERLLVSVVLESLLAEFGHIFSQGMIHPLENSIKEILNPCMRREGPQFDASATLAASDMKIEW